MQNPAPFIRAKNVDRYPSIFLLNNEDTAVIAHRVGSHPHDFALAFMAPRLDSINSKQNTSYGSFPPTKNRFLNKKAKCPFWFMGIYYSLLLNFSLLYCSLG